jgi:ABC-type glycerol-3-phosphate transport system substrate-binding protein
MRISHLLAAAGVGVLLAAGAAGPASAGQLPDNCTKDHGTVTCTTFDGPGNNQGGVGETTIDETQGNTKNKSPEESQDLDSSSSCKPPSSQGAPCNP